MNKFLVFFIVIASVFGGYNINQSNTNEIRSLISDYVDEAVKATGVLGADTVLPIGGTTYNLSGSGVNGSATSITLASLTIPQTGQKLQDSDFSSTFYITLEPGNRSRQEIASCTTVTQNVSGTATLSGCSRGLSPITPYTASTTLQFAHAGGSQVIFSNPPQLYNQFAGKDNDETVSGTWLFSSTSVPRYDLVPLNHNSGAIVSTTSEFASVKFVQQVSASGCLDAGEGNQGCVELATDSEQAAGTENGSEAKLVLQAKNATNTPSYPQTVSGLKTVVTNSLGFIHNMFISTTSDYRWSGLNFFTGSTTLATTTISASTSNRLTLNGVPYTFPTTQGASSTVLVNNGSGVLTYIQPDWTLISSTTTPSAYSSTTIQNIPAKGDLRVIVEIPGCNTNCQVGFRFNSDSGPNYGWIFYENSVYNNSGSANNNGYLQGDASGTTTSQYFVVDISNTATSRKMVLFRGAGGSTGAVVPVLYEGNAVWNNTSSQITRIDIITGSPSITFNAGMRVDVFGKSY